MPTKVMIIDDSVLVLSVLRHQLEQAGFEVATREAASGTASASLRFAPDIILVDVTKPHLSADAFVPSLRKSQNRADVRILLFCDQPAEVLHNLASQAGADGFIAKGTPPATLVAQLHACLKGRAAAGGVANPGAPQIANDAFILCVDGDPGLRALCPLMASFGSVGFIQSGHEALQIIQGALPPAWVFAGVRLLDMRGEDLWQAASALDAFWSDRVILMSDTEAAITPGPSPRRVPRPAALADIDNLHAIMRGR